MIIRKTDLIQIITLNVIGSAIAFSSLIYLINCDHTQLYFPYLEKTVFLYLILSASGGVWMQYRLVKQKKMQSMAYLIAIFPYSFIWYYFTIYKNGI